MSVVDRINQFDKKNRGVIGCLGIVLIFVFLVWLNRSDLRQTAQDTHTAIDSLRSASETTDTAAFFDKMKRSWPRDVGSIHQHEDTYAKLKTEQTSDGLWVLTISSNKLDAALHDPLNHNGDLGTGGLEMSRELTSDAVFACGGSIKAVKKIVVDLSATDKSRTVYFTTEFSPDSRLASSWQQLSRNSLDALVVQKLIVTRDTASGYHWAETY